MSDSDSPVMRKSTGGRRKIPIEFIEDKSRRTITFSKRKAGIMKKAFELSTLTGTQVLLLVASETGHVYTFATPKLQPMITKPEGKNLIQSCLNAPDQIALQPTQQPQQPQPSQPQHSYRHGTYPDVGAICYPTDMDNISYPPFQNYSSVYP
ncbi:serum response factor homolog A-like [Zophobas morio]|uniref:serum response factor homolog A-like n=1 Tax=Zophobas morio TaxID=2755281 RepID=UPI0030834218